MVNRSTIKSNLLSSKFFILFNLFWFLYPTNAISSETKELNIKFHNELINFAFFYSLTEEMCTRLGIRLKQNDLPSERSLAFAEQNNSDGDGPRNIDVEKYHPKLVQVPESYFSVQFVAYTLDQSIVINSWDDLKNYSVAYVLGWKIMDNHVKKARSITKIRGSEKLFRFLSSGRTQVILSNIVIGADNIEKLKIKNIKRSKTLLMMEHYLYLSPKNRALAKPLAQNCAT